MALTKISRGLLDTGVSDSSDATAITIDSSENCTFTGTTTTTGYVISNNTALYDDHSTLSAYSDTNGVYLNGKNAGWLSVSGDGTQRTYIRLFGQSYSDERIQFNTANSEKMRIDSSGNVGVGTTTPTLGKFQVHGSKYVVTNSGQALGGIHVSPDSGAALGEYGGAISFSAGGNGSSAIAAVNTTGSDNDSMGLAFFTHGSSTGSADATERMRIDANGALLIGTTTHTNNSSGNETVAEFVFDHYSRGVEIRSTVGGSNQPFLGFRYGGGPTDCGGIRRDGGNQTPEFFSGSDRRIKTNIQDMDDTLSKICQMPLVKYDLKDGSGSGVGVLAQDLIDIFPEKVTTTDDGKGETLPEGVEAWTVGHNYTYQILKAIQELSAKVEELESKINE